MFIDWFTVSAQVLNFLLLVWLMKRYLYKPILKAIDAREERIAAELADAASKQVEANRERDEFHFKNEIFDLQRSELLSQARDDARDERKRLLEEARQAADDLRGKRQDALNREQKSLNDEIIRRTREEVFAIARKTLTDLAGTTLEARMIDVFAQRLRELAGEPKAYLIKTLKELTEPVLVRSAFELSAEQRAAIQQALKETFLVNIHLRFETAPGVISGIEFIANGRKVAWSIADHCVSLEKNVRELLQAQPKPQAKPAAKTESEAETFRQEVEHP